MDEPCTGLCRGLSFFHDSTESSDFKSAGCQDGIFGQL